MINKNFTTKLIIFFAFILCALFFSRNAFAATLNITTDISTLDQGQIFTATLVLNTEGQSINTIEGDLKYDSDAVKAEAVDTGNSFVNFWVEKPDVKTLGDIHFSGVTPGGISTTNGVVLKIIFKAQNVGGTSLTLDNVNLYLNDGKGSVASTKTQNAAIKVSALKSTDSNVSIVFNDKVPPEEFSVLRAKDPSIFNDKYFIVFSTMDKGSGVDHYQVCELFGCVTGTSPFLLRNQSAFYKITVKAYDINGNMTSSCVTSGLFYALVIFLLFIIFVIIYACFYLRRNRARG